MLLPFFYFPINAKCDFEVDSGKNLTFLSYMVK